MKELGQALVDDCKEAIIENVIDPFNQIFAAYPPVVCEHFENDKFDAACPACQKSEENRETRKRLYAAMFAPLTSTLKN
ncbi:MAG: hypothetical protein AB7G06_02690 [Bdellovibrionales bacterium]